MLLHYLAKRGNTKITYFTQLDCVTHTHTQCTCALSSWKKKKCHLWCVWLRLTFVEVVRYPINTAHLLLPQAWRRTILIFSQRLTPWQTWLTQSMWVTHSSMLCSLPRSCLLLPLDCFDSEGWFSSDQVIFFNCHSCFFLWKSMQYLSEKMQFSGFLFPQVVQKHYLDVVGK